MRIIGGRLKGIHLKAPDNLPVRPTKDMAKEALFNILNNSYDLGSCTVLDLFSGTGSMSIEFASRDSIAVLAVDKHFGCVKWVDAVAKKYELKNLTAQKGDVLKFLDQHTTTYDIIFADPPYDLPEIPELSKLVFKNKLLNENGILIVEHPVFLKLNNQEGFKEVRSYGNSAFSFFENN